MTAVEKLNSITQTYLFGYVLVVEKPLDLGRRIAATHFTVWLLRLVKGLGSKVENKE